MLKTRIPLIASLATTGFLLIYYGVQLGTAKLTQGKVIEKNYFNETTKESQITIELYDGSLVKVNNENTILMFKNNSEKLDQYISEGSYIRAYSFGSHRNVLFVE